MNERANLSEPPLLRAISGSPSLYEVDETSRVPEDRQTRYIEPTPGVRRRVRRRSATRRPRSTSRNTAVDRPCSR